MSEHRVELFLKLFQSVNRQNAIKELLDKIDKEQRRLREKHPELERGEKLKRALRA